MEQMKKLILTAGMLGFLLAPSAPVYAYGADPVNRGPLNVFSRDQVQCGKGWRLRGLIWGDRPVSVCMLRVKRSGFGGPL